jgi:hypothetical protein
MLVEDFVADETAPMEKYIRVCVRHDDDLRHPLRLHHLAVVTDTMLDGTV